MRAIILAAAVLAQLGCHHCPSVEKSPVAVCVVPSAGWDPSASYYERYQINLDLAGPVLSAGDGAPPDDCPSSAVAGWRYSGVDVDSGWWLRLADEAGVSWTIGLALYRTSRSVQEGDQVSFRLEWWENTWGPDETHFELRDAAGDLVAWVGQGYELTGLEPPVELTYLATGLPACSGAEECGSWIGYALDVRVRGHLGMVPLGGSTVIDGLRVFNAKLLRDHQSGPCSDWGMTSTLVAAAR